MEHSEKEYSARPLGATKVLSSSLCVYVCVWFTQRAAKWPERPQLVTASLLETTTTKQALLVQNSRHQIKHTVSTNIQKYMQHRPKCYKFETSVLLEMNKFSANTHTLNTVHKAEPCSNNSPWVVGRTIIVGVSMLIMCDWGHVKSSYWK